MTTTNHTSPPSPADEPPDKPRQWLLEQLQTRPAETIATIGTGLAGLGSVLILLGYLAHRAREGIAGIPTHFNYPTQALLYTGLEALGALPWRGLAALTSNCATVRASAWLLAAVTVACLVIGRWLPRRWPSRWWRPAVALLLAATAVTLTIGGAFFTIAIRATNLETKAPGNKEFCGSHLSANLADRIAFETCSWLTNESPRNDERRNSLGGLVAWFLLAALASAWTGLGIRDLRPRSRLLGPVLVAVHLALIFFFVARLPQAHAFARWGMKVPAVKIKADCDKALAAAIDAGTCCAFDVSDRAAERWIMLRGQGCPGGGGVRRWQDDEKHCIIMMQQKARVFVQVCG